MVVLSRYLEAPTAIINRDKSAERRRLKHQITSNQAKLGPWLLATIARDQNNIGKFSELRLHRNCGSRKWARQQIFDKSF